MKVDLTKVSPSPGFMHSFETEEVTLTQAPAIRETFLLTKSKGNITMDDILEILKNADIDASDLEEQLKEEGIDEDGIEAAKAISVISKAFSDEVTPEVLAKSLGIEVGDSTTPSDDATDDTDDTQKSDDDVQDLPESVQKRLEKLDELEERVEKSEREKRISKWEGRVNELETISKDGLAEDLADMEEEFSKDRAEKYLERLRSADEVAKSADIGKEHGSSGRGQSTSDAYSKLKAKAQEIRERDGDISTAKAMQKARKENPEIADEYMKEFE